MRSTKLVTGPVTEPISLNEAKLHLKIDTSPISEHPDDSLVGIFIRTARRFAEEFQNRAYITQVWRLSMDCFPREHFIQLPRPPLQSIIAFSYYDGSTTQVVSFVDPSGTPVFDTSEYIVDTESEPGRLCLKPGYSWPAAVRQANSIQLEFIAGYGAAKDIPDEIKTAILLKISDLYENRGDEPVKYASDNPLERSVKALLWPSRIIPI